MDKLTGLTLNFKLWFSVETDDRSIPVFGEHKIQLLKLIQKTGSIKAASERIEIDYKKAHDMIEDMNAKVAPYKLVVSERGRGKGTSLTLLANELIRMYEEATTNVLTTLTNLRLDSQISIDSGDLSGKIQITKSSGQSEN